MAQHSQLRDWAEWAFSPSVSAILFTLILSLTLPLCVHFYLYRKTSPKALPTILLVGPSGGGKTSLLTLFSNGTPSITHTSQSPQKALCQLPSSTRSTADQYRSENDPTASSRPQFLLHDTPGHGKLRHHALSALSSTPPIKGLIFLLDSAALSASTGLTAAAEYLHDILLLLQKQHTQSRTSKDPAPVPVLVACNKQDVFTSLPAGIVRQRLEEEITKVRATRSKGLMDSGEGDEGEEEGNWLGEYGSERFRFVQMRECGVEVTVAGGSVKGDGEGGGVQEWWEWVGGVL